MNINSYRFVATLALLLLSALPAGNAFAQDSYGSNYGNQAAPQAQGAAQVYDNHYTVPPVYQGEYYPQETESAIGYHGAANTSDNRGSTSEEPYYMYYY